MAHVAIVFESMFGNTERVARAIAAGLGEELTVDVLRACPAVRLAADVELLVVGAPTHAFSLSRRGTRASTGPQGVIAEIAGGPGLREWIDGLRFPSAAAPAVAAFDTRIRRRGVPGSAAMVAERKFRRIGLPILAPATSFWVDGTTGPVVPSEEERARQWGVHLGALLRERLSILA
jgi:hypothetical protein